MLGCGVVSVGGAPIGLTRGGSVFAVEREIREIEADCDRGPVKGRVVIDEERAKLTVNALELFSADEINRYYPGLTVDSGNSAYDVVTGTLEIAAEDYNAVQFVGKTKDGKAVTIELDDAINFEGIEWTFTDKDEVVPALVFTATYDEDTRETPPWRVKLSKGDSYKVTFTVTDTGGNSKDATVTLYGRKVKTNSSGVAEFLGIPEGQNHVFTVAKGGYQVYTGAVTVDGQDETVSVALTAI